MEGHRQWCARTGRQAEEVVARPLEKLMGGKPRWQKSSPGKEQWRLNHGKKCGFPRDAGHQHEREDLGKDPS